MESAVRVLLNQEFNITNERMERKVFESLYYRLLVAIDPSVKRRFRLIGPSKNDTQASKFIELVCDIINDLRILPYTIRPSRLSPLGGHPFRLLTSKLIQLGLDTKISNYKKILGVSCSDNFDQLVANIADNEKKTKQLLDEYSAYIVEKKSEHQQYHQILDLWKNLCLSCDVEVTEPNFSTHKQLAQILDTKFTAAVKNFELKQSMVDKVIRSLELSSDFTKNRRKSKAFMRMQRSILKIEQPQSASTQIMEYEEAVETFLTKVEAKRLDMENELLNENTQVAKDYKDLCAKIPCIQLEIPSERPLPSYIELLNILKKFPDSKYDDREVLSTLKSYVN